MWSFFNIKMIITYRNEKAKKKNIPTENVEMLEKYYLSII